MLKLKICLKQDMVMTLPISSPKILMLKLLKLKEIQKVQEEKVETEKTDLKDHQRRKDNKEPKVQLKVLHKKESQDNPDNQENQDNPDNKKMLKKVQKEKSEREEIDKDNNDEVNIFITKLYRKFLYLCNAIHIKYNSLLDTFIYIVYKHLLGINYGLWYRTSSKRYSTNRK